MLKILVLFLFFSTVTVESSYAYIDFGTGSIMLQIIATSVIGFIFLIKNYMYRIKQFFRRKHPTDEDININSNEQD